MGVKNLKIIFLALLFAVNFFFFSEINKLYNKPTNTLFHRITYFFMVVIFFYQNEKNKIIFLFLSIRLIFYFYIERHRIDYL